MAHFGIIIAKVLKNIGVTRAKMMVLDKIVNCECNYFFAKMRKVVKMGVKC